MRPEEAIEYVRQRFPFEDYMDPEDGAYLNIALTTQRYLKPGDSVLDFGAGPCDKTAVLQVLGFRCSAYDDLQDQWHSVGGNRKRVVRFVSEMGIDFRLATDGPLPFEKCSFDMLMMHDILEHLHDSPRDIVNDFLEMLRPGGYFFATVPNAVNLRKRLFVLFGKSNMPRFEDFYWYPGPWRGHVREYTSDDLEKLADYLNLGIVELRSCHHMIQKLPAAARPIFRAVTKVFPGWRDTWMLVARKPNDWARKEPPEGAGLKRIVPRSTPYRSS